MDAFADAGIFETLVHTDAVGFVSDFSAYLIEIVLGISVLDMGKQLGAFSHQNSFLRADRFRSNIGVAGCRI